jgi:hypothetical protein
LNSYRVVIRARAADPQNALLGEDLGEDGDAGPVPPLLEGDVGREQPDPHVGDGDVLPGNAVERVIPDAIPPGRSRPVGAGAPAAEAHCRGGGPTGEKRPS